MLTQEELSNINVPSIATPNNSILNNNQQSPLPSGSSGKKKYIIARIWFLILIGVLVLTITGIVLVRQWQSNERGGSAVPNHNNSKGIEINLKTTLLATIPEEYIKNKSDIRGNFLDYGKKVFWYAYSKVPGETNKVIVNGDVNNKIEHYNIISGDITTPLVYKKQDENKKYILSVDGKDYPLGDASPSRIMSEHTGSGTVVYVKQSANGASQVVINGIAGKGYKAILGLAMSQDGKHVAYAASSGNFPLGQTTLVIDGQEKSTNYNFIALPTFSPDGTKLAYFAVSGIKAGDKDLSNTKCVAVVNEKESPIECSELLFLSTSSETEGASSSPYILFSPDSKQVAFIVYVGGKAYLSDPEGSYTVLNSKKGKQYAQVGPMSFSPDSKNFVYLAFTSDKKPIIVINGEEVGVDSPMNVEKIVWSPDSKRFAYTSNREYVSVYDMDTKKLETKKLTPYSSDLQFSSDGKQLLFIKETLVPYNSPGSFTVKTDIVDAYSEAVIVENGRSIVFSYDGKHFAALASASAGSTISDHIVVDGKKGLSYDEIWTDPQFSLDGKFVGYGVKKGNELWWIVDSVN